VANWAVVVGVDRYWSDAAHLKGAVRDALAMREWLLDPPGGDVPADNLQLVLAPGPNGAQPEADVEWALGTKANIIVAINDLMQLSGGQGERLYFYFAGHGLTARVSNRDESALLGTDFTSINTDNSIALRSLWEYFETTQFADQFFFVDACRNVPPWGEGAEFELGRWTPSWAKGSASFLKRALSGSGRHGSRSTNSCSSSMSVWLTPCLISSMR